MTVVVQLSNKVKNNENECNFLAKCKAFSSKTITVPIDMKEGLALSALNRESICPPLATAQ